MIFKTPSVSAWLQAKRTPQKAQKAQKRSTLLVPFVLFVATLFHVRALESAFEIDRFEAGGPVFDGSAIWL